MRLYRNCPIWGIHLIPRLREAQLDALPRKRLSTIENHRPLAVLNCSLDLLAKEREPSGQRALRWVIIVVDRAYLNVIDTFRPARSIGWTHPSLAPPSSALALRPPSFLHLCFSWIWPKQVGLRSIGLTILLIGPLRRAMWWALGEEVGVDHLRLRLIEFRWVLNCWYPTRHETVTISISIVFAVGKAVGYLPIEQACRLGSEWSLSYRQSKPQLIRWRFHQSRRSPFWWKQERGFWVRIPYRSSRERCW